jgi:hypothetical protein
MDVIVIKCTNGTDRMAGCPAQGTAHVLPYDGHEGNQAAGMHLDAQ